MKKNGMQPFGILWKVHNPDWGNSNRDRRMYLIGWLEGLILGGLISHSEFHAWLNYIDDLYF